MRRYLLKMFGGIFVCKIIGSAHLHDFRHDAAGDEETALRGAVHAVDDGRVIEAVGFVLPVLHRF